MKRYLPAKRAMLCLYLVLTAVGLGMDMVLSRYLTIVPEEYIKLISAGIWVVILIVALIVIPHYFLKAKVVITKTEIATAGGFISYRNDYMPIGSVRSVSIIITPLGLLTGFNFVVVNALGSRLLMSFVRKRDAEDISATINGLIKEMEKRNE